MSRMMLLLLLHAFGPAAPVALSKEPRRDKGYITPGASSIDVPAVCLLCGLWYENGLELDVLAVVGVVEEKDQCLRMPCGADGVWESSSCIRDTRGVVDMRACGVE